MILDFKDLSSFATGETYMSEKDSIEARAEALASEYFGPEFDGSHLTRKEAFVAGYKVCQQELDRQASDAVEKERERIADELRACKAKVIERESVMEAEADERSTRADVVAAFEVGLVRGYEAALSVIEPDIECITQLRGQSK